MGTKIYHYHLTHTFSRNNTNFGDRWTKIFSLNTTKLGYFGVRKWTETDGVHLSFYVYAKSDGHHYAKYPLNFTLASSNYIAEIKEAQILGGDSDKSYIYGIYTKGFDYYGWSDGKAMALIEIIFRPYST